MHDWYQQFCVFLRYLSLRFYGCGIHLLVRASAYGRVNYVFLSSVRYFHVNSRVQFVVLI